MKITIEMLLTSFFAEHPEAAVPFSQNEKVISGIRLLPDDKETLNPDYLYVTNRTDLTDFGELSDDIFLICFENARGGSLHLPFELAHGFNDLQNCYNAFADWERTLDFAVFRGTDFQELIDLAKEMIQSPMLVYDPALKLLAWTKHHDTLNDRLFQNAVKNGYLDIDAVQYFEQTGTFEQAHESGSFAAEPDGFRMHADYLKQINIGNELAVYAILLFTDELPHSYEKQLFDILCDAFYKLLEKQHSTFLRDRSVTDYFLMDLLDNPETSIEQIRERLYYNDLEYEGNYILFLIDSDVKKKSAEQFFLQFLRTNLINCHIFPYREAIVVLYHLPKSEALTYQDIVTIQLERIIKGYSSQKIRIYVSKPFTTISSFSDAYLQANSIRNMQLPGTDHEISFFEDYWIWDLMQQNPVSNKTFFYCEPCLLDLIKKDTKKSRQQFDILYEYLNCDRNYTNVANKMHMHRNNVIYHIKNLEEAYQLDLDDASVRLKLLISFELLKMQQ